MFLTPPDVISQVLLAIPVWILFEGGVFASAIIFKDKLEQAEADEAELNDTDNVIDDSDYQPLTDEEMEAELDREENKDSDSKPEPGP